MSKDLLPKGGISIMSMLMRLRPHTMMNMGQRMDLFMVGIRNYWIKCSKIHLSSSRCSAAWPKILYIKRNLTQTS
jgi:hypothetical protein